MHKKNKIRLAMLLAMLVPATALGGKACEPLQLSAAIKGGYLVAKLTNGSDRPVKTVGHRVSPVPGFGGFYVELRKFNKSNVIKYCGMIDNEVPKATLLQPGESITYREPVSSIANQYCLDSGEYIVHVAYYNSVEPDGIMYSQPARSSAFKLIIRVGYQEDTTRRGRE